MYPVKEFKVFFPNRSYWCDHNRGMKDNNEICWFSHWKQGIKTYLWSLFLSRNRHKSSNLHFLFGNIGTAMPSSPYRPRRLSSIPTILSHPCICAKSPVDLATPTYGSFRISQGAGIFERKWSIASSMSSDTLWGRALHSSGGRISWRRRRCT